MKTQVAMQAKQKGVSGEKKLVLLRQFIDDVLVSLAITFHYCSMFRLLSSSLIILGNDKSDASQMYMYVHI